MNQSCKKVIISLSVLIYLGTVQAMAMMMPAGFQGNHCQVAHTIAISYDTEGSFDAEGSLNAEGSAKQTKELSNDSHQCMACFVITAERIDYLSCHQPLNDLQSAIKEFCSVALTILSPPPKRHLS